MALPLSPGGKRYGYRRDYNDRRDLDVASSPVMKSLHLRRNDTLAPWCGPVKNQLDLGSCTGHAYSSIDEYLTRRYLGQGPIFSPLFLYYMERVMEGSIDIDNGAMPRTGCEVLSKFGCCEESVDPYDTAKFTVAPTQAQLDNAKKWRANTYHRIIRTEDVLSCIGSGYPCSVGFTVFSSFEGEQVANTGFMPMPKRHEEILGGHEVMCMGYDLDKEAILIQNSWGTDWGIEGRFWMPLEFVRNADYVSDIWMCHLGKPWGR